MDKGGIGERSGSMGEEEGEGEAWVRKGVRGKQG